MKVRINDLARELEVKTRSILEALAEVGIFEPKTFSSSIEEDQAYLVRAYFSRGDRAAEFAKSAKEKMAVRFASTFKPGDALQAILDRKKLEKLTRDRPSETTDNAIRVAAHVLLRPLLESEPLEPTMVPTNLNCVADQKPTVTQTETYGASEIAELRRELIRYFNILESKAGVNESMKRKGFNDRIHALRNSALIPRTIAGTMFAFAEFRNDLEYSPEGKLSESESRLLKEMDFFLRLFLRDRAELLHEKK